jgi:E3 ubiquitin-protein ligase DOA10
MAKQCRFCLESETNSTDEMIEPCACRGSVQYVHQLCLTKWARMDPENNATNCSICKFPFTIHLVIHREVIPVTKTASLFVVDQTLVASMIFHTAFAASCRVPLSVENFKQGQMWFALLYTYCYTINISVRNTQVYRRSFLTSYFPLLMVTYVYLSYRLMYHNDLGYSAAVNISMNLLWREHLRILRLINDQ